jgi:acyl carrier protein
VTGASGGPGNPDGPEAPDAPDEAAIAARIRDYIVRSARLAAPPGDEDGLVALGFVPSVRMLDLVGFLEDEFHIELRPVDLAPDRLATIARMTEMVQARLRSRPRSPRSSS